MKLRQIWLGFAAALLSTGLLAPQAAVAVEYDISSASSLQVVVNKHRALNPATYVPASLSRVSTERLRSEAASAYNAFVKAGKSAGVTVRAVSGYRSYSEQQSLYSDYVARYGQSTADTLAARPGYSEHQTGLAMDVGNASGVCAMQACFADTPVGRFAAAEGWKYGFIIRYPYNAQGTTGYTYEPWHLRYVGVALATDMRDKGITTLEGYFGLEDAPDYLR
ncbi:M15 family metallopeptidase [Paenarthrobacter ureafaciens]|jgi:D-alanyl-D-alanine carboxypeptidase|uniref:M15 family metallopeptidase n=1 Tax=Paenarthrobacter ureafaciens TaxID=37931 RepID=UPI00140BAEE7|nr:M15 family metallopeptidase [Paenarthrobacter ureafaciens]MCX8454780.1 M15 family metallopeptidase [Paenarthrobacter ureafaciens]MCY0973586.1 M15 family metallopeptidase [Paenarthrobacter ureafaciens]